MENADHIHLLDHSIVPDANPPRGASRELDAADGARAHGEAAYRGNDTGLRAAVNACKLLLRNAQDIDRIVHA